MPAKAPADGAGKMSILFNIIGINVACCTQERRKQLN